MANLNMGMDVAIAAGEDLRAAQYKAIAIGGTVSAANGTAIGFLNNKPNTGEDASLRFLGIAKGTASAAITAGARVKVTTSGYVVTVSSGDGACGKALTTVTSGAVVELLVDMANAATTY